MWATLLWANVLHGLVALVWATGVRRLVAPRSPVFAVSLASLCLVAPVAVGLARLLGVPPLPERWGAVRVERWLEAAAASELPLGALALTLLAGTSLLFLAQELRPALGGRRRWHGVPRASDPRLDAALAAALAGFRAQGSAQRAPAIARLETEARVATLAGVRAPSILVSRGLMARLDDEQLEAVVAHELAHLVLGGNRRLLVLWLLRAVQAPSPAALVLFRGLVEALERACDALAAAATGRPAALGSALMEASRREARVDGARAPDAWPDPLAEMLRRSERALTRARVQALLEGAPAARTPGPALLVAGALLGTLLWAIC